MSSWSSLDTEPPQDQPELYEAMPQNTNNNNKMQDLWLKK